MGGLETGINQTMIGTIVAWASVLFVWLFQAGLTASLARQKGYSGLAGFFVGLAAPGLGLIYEAGRPVSQDMEDERQRLQAVRIAKAIRRSEQEQAKVFQAEEKKDSRRRRYLEDR